MSLMMKWLLIVLGVLLCAPLASGDEARPGEDVYQTSRLWTIHIRMGKPGWEMMRPTRAPRLAVVLRISTADEPADDEKPYVEGQRLEPCPFGYEYAYVRGTVELDGETVSDVGVRFKGNSSYQYYADTLKRPMKLDFDRFIKDQEFHGLKTINLGNNALDPSQLREALSYEMFRLAGVPAPRTAFALVYLTVEGLHDRQFVGLYTMVEEVDKDFLKMHYGTSKGLLLKPEGIRDLPYLGEKAADYGRYEAKTEAPAKQWTRLFDFLRLLHLTDTETFQSAIDAYLATDQFLRFIAVHTLIINMDSFLGGGHNYYIYVHPEDGRLYFMPWDQNFSFGQYGRDGETLSIDSPMSRPNTLIERVLMNEANREAYRGHIEALVQSSFSAEQMLARIEKYEAIVKKGDEAAAAQTQPTTMPARTINRNRPDLKVFVPERVESVLAQLSGERMGYIPGERAPQAPPSIFPKTAPPRVPLPPRSAAKLAKQTARAEARPAPPAPRPVPSAIPSVFLRAADSDRNGTLTRDELADTVLVFYRSAASDQGQSLDALAVADALDRVSILLEPGMVQPASASPATQPAIRFSLQWARMLVREASSDTDDRLTLEEMQTIAGRWFTEADTDHNQLLAAKEIDALLPRLMAAH